MKTLLLVFVLSFSFAGCSDFKVEKPISEKELNKTDRKDTTQNYVENGDNSVSSEEEYQDSTHERSVEYENSLYVILPHFDLKMPDFFSAEYPMGGDYLDLFVDKSSEIGDITLKYLVGGISGHMGSPFDNVLEIIQKKDEENIKSVEQKFATTLLFNEDGSGGVFNIEGIDTYESGWVKLEEVDFNAFATISREDFDQYKPPISDKDIDRAESYIAGQEIETYYNEEVINSEIKIIYEVGGETYNVNMIFDFEYGD